MQSACPWHRAKSVIYVSGVSPAFASKCSDGLYSSWTSLIGMSWQAAPNVQTPCGKVRPLPPEVILNACHSTSQHVVETPAKHLRFPGTNVMSLLRRRTRDSALPAAAGGLRGRDQHGARHLQRGAGGGLLQGAVRRAHQAEVCMVAGTLGGAQQLLGEAPAGACFSGKAEEVVGEVSGALNRGHHGAGHPEGGSLRHGLSCAQHCVRLGQL